MPDVWGLAAIAAKFSLYLGILTAAGTVLATLVFQLERTRGLALTFAAVGVLATVLDFALRGGNLTGNLSGMTDPEMLGLLWSTPVGTAFVLRLGGLAMLIAGLFVGQLGIWLSCFGGLLALWSFGHVGHVPEKGSVLLDMALMAHLAAIALWIGVLTPLRRLASAGGSHSAAADLGHRFGRVASVTVPTLVVLGGYMGYALAGSLQALVTTGYGLALILKVVLVVGLLGLAAMNKVRFVPALRMGDAMAARGLVRSIGLEWVIVLKVLLLTAVLTSHLRLPI